MFSYERTESTTYRMLSTLVATQSNHVNQHFFFPIVQAAQSIPGVEGAKPPPHQAIQFIMQNVSEGFRGGEDGRALQPILARCGREEPRPAVHV